MTAVMPGRFGNRELRPTKRRLSVFEKQSLPTTSGRALILPGEPNTEVEELVDVGYNSCHVFGVEQSAAAYTNLRRHYHDSANIFHGDVFDWMSKAHGNGQYSYIHLDFCGHFTEEEAVGCQQWRLLAAPTSRVRVSVFRGRRSPAQFDWEARMHEDLLLEWCQLGYDLDMVDPERWVTYHDHFQETVKDTTNIIVALAVLNFFFGVADYRQYVDASRREGSHLPSVEGGHVLTNTIRYTYNEPNSPNHMYTVWTDLQPISDDPLRNSTQWTLNELSKIFESLSYHIPAFNPATM